MSFVTQGTVQVLRTASAEAEIFINPTPDYAVKHNEKDYIVFVDTGSSPPGSRLCEKKTKVCTSQEAHFIEMLTAAAFQRTKIEIRMNVDFTKIEGLKIPA